ncbi:hypothetical protein ACFPVT_07270 [Corynebacterium choanae]|uniref:Uncharacterized protein n=1 Tax=Corynebacterium choanae TaxID=1862358 RepID=A0A3G6J7D4_9CORY|nr:hypothetical protein [Corynebacterium choanae]AZA13896.1 hypothetical protein CCHOA_07520 [Corynebacterium choanae]
MQAATNNPIADPTDSLLGWASETELALRSRCHGHELFHQLGLSADELEGIERFYGLFLSRQLAAGAAAADLIAITPTLAVATLVGRSARMISAETFFTEWAGGLGLPGDSSVIEAITDDVPGLFQEVGLHVPAGLIGDDPTLTVALCALHAGVTGGEVPWLIELVDCMVKTAEEQQHELTAQQIIEVIASGDYAPVLRDDITGHDDTESLDEDDLALRAEYEGIGRDLSMTSLCARHAAELLTPTIAGVLATVSTQRNDPVCWLRKTHPADVELSPLVFAQVFAELRERPFGTVHRSWAVGVATREWEPRIVFDPVRGKVCLRLPEQLLPADGGDIHWRVTIGGTTRIHRTGRPAGSASPYSAALDLSIDKQVREITVTDTANDAHWVLPVVDSADPVLVFTRKGFNLTDKKSLHYSELTVIHPEDATITDPVTGNPVPVVDAVALKGWKGWTVSTVDASDALSMQVLRPGQQPSPMKQVRCIDPRQRAVFHSPEPVDSALESSSGLPVHAASLVAEFPPTISGDDERWWLSISAYAGPGLAGEEIAEPEPLDVPADGGVFDVFDPEAYDDPWCGEYLVRLRGPRNESFRHQFAIVEGLTVEPMIGAGETGVRIPARGGLTPAKLVIRAGEKPFVADPKTIDVAADQAAGMATIHTDGGDMLPVRYVPPQLRFEIPTVGVVPMWRTTRLVIGPRQLAVDGTLRVRAPHTMRSPFVQLVNAQGAPLATVKLTTKNEVTYTAAMSKLAAAAATMVRGSLLVEWVDQASKKKLSVTVATITPDPLPTAATIDDGVLRVTPVDRDRPIGVWVWPQTAPWELGRTLAADETGAVPLPASLVDAGPLIVQPHPGDAFTRLRAPLVPSQSALTVHQPGYFAGGKPLLNQLAAFLSGEVDTLPEDRTVMPILWEVLASLPPVSSRDEAAAAVPQAGGSPGAGQDNAPGDDGATADGDPAGVDDAASSVAAAPVDPRAAVLAALQAHPARALAGLSRSLVPADQAARWLIQSGLVTKPFTGSLPVDEDHRQPWITTLLLLGALPGAYQAAGFDTDPTASADTAAAESGKLEHAGENTEQVDTAAGEQELAATAAPAALEHSLVQQPPVDPAQARKDYRHLVEQLVALSGNRLVETLYTGRDHTLDTACVDQQTVSIAHMNPAQQQALLDMFFNRADIVPGPFMDDEARLLAVFETFNQRADLSQALADRTLIETSVKLLKALRGTNRQLYQAARVRFDKLGDTDTGDARNVWALTPVISLVFALCARLHAHGKLERTKLLQQATDGWSALADMVPDLVTGDVIAAEAMVQAVLYPGIGS